MKQGCIVILDISSFKILNLVSWFLFATKKRICTYLDSFPKGILIDSWPIIGVLKWLFLIDSNTKNINILILVPTYKILAALCSLQSITKHNLSWVMRGAFYARGCAGAWLAPVWGRGRGALPCHVTDCFLTANYWSFLGLLINRLTNEAEQAALSLSRQTNCSNVCSLDLTQQAGHLRIAQRI